MTKKNHGGVGWFIIAAYAAIYDYWAIKTGRETLSAAFGRSLRNPYVRPLTFIVVLGLLKHLFFPRWLPQVDPMAALANKWRGVDVD